MIIRRIVDRRKELGLTTKQVAERVANSELYGHYTHGTLRNLENQDFEDPSNPRTTLNRQLVIALSEALECDVSMLANHRELEAIRDVPYRRAQWPAFMLDDEKENSPGGPVPQPGKTASIIDAYRQQYGYGNYTYFAHSIANNGYRITPKQLVQAIGERRKWSFTRKYVTYELCEAVAKLFRGPSHKDEFHAEWLITCRTDGRCPHCDPRLITY